MALDVTPLAHGLLIGLLTGLLTCLLACLSITLIRIMPADLAEVCHRLSEVLLQDKEGGRKDEALQSPDPPDLLEAIDRASEQYCIQVRLALSPYDIWTHLSILLVFLFVPSSPSSLLKLSIQVPLATTRHRRLFAGACLDRLKYRLLPYLDGRVIKMLLELEDLKRAFPTLWTLMNDYLDWGSRGPCEDRSMLARPPSSRLSLPYNDMQDSSKLHTSQYLYRNQQRVRDLFFELVRVSLCPLGSGSVSKHPAPLNSPVRRPPMGPAQAAFPAAQSEVSFLIHEIWKVLYRENLDWYSSFFLSEYLRLNASTLTGSHGPPMEKICISQGKLNKLNERLNAPAKSRQTQTRTKVTTDHSNVCVCVGGCRPSGCVYVDHPDVHVHVLRICFTSMMNASPLAQRRSLQPKRLPKRMNLSFSSSFVPLTVSPSIISCNCMSGNACIALSMSIFNFTLQPFQVFWNQPPRPSVWTGTRKSP